MKVAYRPSLVCDVTCATLQHQSPYVTVTPCAKHGQLTTSIAGTLHLWLQLVDVLF